MANVPSGYTYYDKSAAKYIAAGSAMPTPANGDQLYYGIGDSGYWIYDFYVNKTTTSGDTYTGWWCWARQSTTNLNRTSQPAILSSINGYEVWHVDMCGCKIATIPSIPNTVKDMYRGFENCSALTNVSSWVPPSSLKSCNRLFYNCKTLSNAGFTMPGTVVDMGYAFYECALLTTAPSLDNLPSNASLTLSFWGCRALTHTPQLSAFIENLDRTFYQCYRLNTITNLPSNLKSLYSAFYMCEAITSVNIPSNVEDMQYAFYGCTELHDVTLNIDNIKDMKYAFYGCTKLSTVNNDNNKFRINTSNLISWAGAFGNAGNSSHHIVLLDPSHSTGQTLKYIATTGNSNNVFAGFTPNISSFICVRGIIEEGEWRESATGNMLQFEVYFSSPSVTGAYLRPLDFGKIIDNVETPITLDWYLDEYEDPTKLITDSSTIGVPNSGKLIARYELSSSEVEGALYYTYAKSYYLDGSTPYNFTSNRATSTLTVKDFILDISPDGKKIAIGKAADDFEGVEFGVPVKFSGSSLQSLINIFYPIGTIYETSDINFNPSSVWGGTWSRIVGRVLVGYDNSSWVKVATEGASFTLNTQCVCKWGIGNVSTASTYYQKTLAAGTYTANSTTFDGQDPASGLVKEVYVKLEVGTQQGESYHTLNTSEIPAHTHGSAGAHTHYIKNCSAAGSAATQLESYANGNNKNRSIYTDSSGAHTHASVGNGFTHNNMPPYEAVVIWKRTA